MTLFEPPPREPTLLSPKNAVQRVALDVALGIALGGGAACLLFGWSWMAYRPRVSDPSSSSWFFALCLALIAMVALIDGSWRALEGRWPRIAAWMPHYERLRRVIFALALGWLGLSASQRLAELSHTFTDDFLTLVVLATVIGVISLAGHQHMWREARGRVTPWVVALFSLYLASDWAVKLGPNVDFHGPRADIAFYSLIGCGGFGMCAILAAMDWHIARRNRVSEATNG